jgi:hypothetical protein
MSYAFGEIESNLASLEKRDKTHKKAAAANSASNLTVHVPGHTSFGLARLVIDHLTALNRIT